MDKEWPAEKRREECALHVVLFRIILSTKNSESNDGRNDAAKCLASIN